MTTPWPRFQSLPDDGALWLLTWLGPFYIDQNMPSQRSILAAVSPLLNSAGRTPFQATGGLYPKAASLGTQRLVSFAAGDLGALTLGTLYRGGRAVSRSKELLETATFKLNFDAQRVIRLMEAEAQGLLTQDDLLLGAAWPPMARTACVALPRQNDPYGLLVPVPEVLRWCYGCSSRMVQTVLSSALPGVLAQVSASSSLHEGQFHFTLPDGYLEADAPTLAWLAGDPVARERALGVDLSVIVNTGLTANRPELSHPSAVFPYGGEHTLTVLGRWMEAPDKTRRFLVHRVLNTSYVLPFEVVLPSVQPTEPTSSDEPPVTRNRRTPDADGGRSTVVSGAEPSRGGAPARLGALDSQFSKVEVLRRAVPAPPAPPVRRRGTETSTGTFSTGQGSDSSSSARRVTFVSLDTTQADELAGATDAFSVLRRVLALLRARGFQVQELAVNNPGGRESVFDDWTRRNGAPIRCLIAELRWHDVYIYLLEKERAPKEFSPLVIAWHYDRRASTDDALNEMLKQRAAARTWPKTHSDWVLIHLAHGYSTDETFEAGIRERLGVLPARQAPDQADRQGASKATTPSPDETPH